MFRQGNILTLAPTYLLLCNIHNDQQGLFIKKKELLEKAWVGRLLHICKHYRYYSLNHTGILDVHCFLVN